MSKSIPVVIQEMKRHRKDFMKKSTPYRQLTRAIKQLEKLEQIEQIVKQVESLHPEVAIGDREGIRKIKEILEQE